MLSIELFIRNKLCAFIRTVNLKFILTGISLVCTTNIQGESARVWVSLKHHLCWNWNCVLWFLGEATNSFIFIEFRHSLSICFLDSHKDKVFTLKCAYCIFLCQINENCWFTIDGNSILRVSESLLWFAWCSKWILLSELTVNLEFFEHFFIENGTDVYWPELMHEII